MSEQLVSPAAGTAELQESTELVLLPGRIESVPVFEPWTATEAITARPEQPDRIDFGVDSVYDNPNLIRGIAFALPAGLVCWFVLIELARFVIYILDHTKAGR
jgi:hypothetical protein